MLQNNDPDGLFKPRFSCTVDGSITPGLRLDRYAAENLKLLSRSQIKARNLKAKLNGKDVKISHLLKGGENLEFSWDDAEPVDLIPENIPLDIIYETDRVAVINKAQGMVVHPGAGNWTGTLANALYYHYLEKKKSKSALFALAGLRPGIVHRLDKDTSGIIITAWDDKTHAYLCEQFKSRKVRKNYIAIVCGTPKENKGKIETFITRDPKNRKRFAVSTNGKNAITFYKVIKSWQAYSLLLLLPRTGRTHQLRVHARHIGHPILGDPIYADKDKLFPNAGLMLHSKKLAVTLPGKNEENVFSAPVPERFRAVMEKLDRMYVHG